jgi:hypothetical protein
MPYLPVKLPFPMFPPDPSNPQRVSRREFGRDRATLPIRSPQADLLRASGPVQAIPLTQSLPVVSLPESGRALGIPLIRLLPVASLQACGLQVQESTCRPIL